MTKIHFIGIGGIGVSGLASIFLEKGLKVYGSDLSESEITEALRRKGAEIFIGHQRENLGQVDRVVYSPAIPKNNPEFLKAKEVGIPCLSYPEALAEFSRGYLTIAIAGTHGKSTTASMIAQILIAAGLDPTFIIGTKPGSRLGRGRYLVIEADEYKRSFLNYYPDLLVITNIEADHLDYFKDLADVNSAFQQFKKQAKKIVSWADKKIKLQVPGKHNQKNASAALAVARELGIDEKTARKALFEFKGVWRRFETRGEFNRAIIIDDYAHHPTEIKATLQAAREKYPKKELVAVFQPHQYQRLQKLFADFASSFKEADKVIITSVFSVPGRERERASDKTRSRASVKTGQDLARAIPDAEFVPIKKLASYIKKTARSNQVILMIGAGDIYKVNGAIFTR